MSTIDDKCVKGDIKNLNEFEDNYNPRKLKANLYNLGITKNYADHISRFYEEHVFNAIVRDYKKRK